MVFYHIDRNKTLKLGTVFPFPILQDVEIKKTFPELSQHGAHYLLQNENAERSVLCEWILEYVRATKFLNMPSRFKCFFVTKTEKEALKWADYWNCKDYNLVEIKSNNFFELDCSWFSDPQPAIFTCPTATARIYEEAVKYWSGQRSDTPRLEVLIHYPFEVIRIVHHHD